MCKREPQHGASGTTARAVGKWAWAVKPFSGILAQVGPPVQKSRDDKNRYRTTCPKNQDPKWLTFFDIYTPLVNVYLFFLKKKSILFYFLF